MLTQITIFISTTLNLSLKLRRNLSCCQKWISCNIAITLVKLRRFEWDSWSKTINCKSILFQRWFTLFHINIKFSYLGWLKISFETPEISYTSRMSIWFLIKLNFRSKAWKFLMKLKPSMEQVSSKLITSTQSNDKAWSAWIRSLSKNWSLIPIITSFSNLENRLLVR